MSDAQLNGFPDEAQSLDAPAEESVDYDEMSPEEERLIELVGFLVQGIVSHPEEVEVEEFYDEVGVVYGVRVHPEDIGRVIGKDGRVAGALRHVVKAAATKVGTHVTVEILTEDGAETVAQSSPEI
ncbi:MAG TPA: KH domain-containing protein [Abditibacterium sp.]|jgi:hypothetical protein